MTRFLGTARWLAALSVSAALGTPAVWAGASQVTYIPILADSERALVGQGGCGADGTDAEIDDDPGPDDAAAITAYLAEQRVPTHTEFIRCDANLNGRLDYNDANRLLIGLRAAPYKRGDANGDGKVTSSDATMIKSYLNNGSTAILNIKVYNADCNSDGLLDEHDVQGVLNMAVGLKCN